MLLSVDSLQICELMFGGEGETDAAALRPGGSAMAAVTSEQVGGDEEDVYEDSGPTYVCD